MARWPIPDRRIGIFWASVTSTLLALVPTPTDASGPTRSLGFALHGEARGAKDLDWLAARVPAQRVRVFEPYEAREVVFEALRFDAVLDAVYGPSWRSQEELLFTCADGYQPSVAVRRVLDHEAWLAFARRAQDPDAGEEAFEILKRESGREQHISLAPFYLVWENIEDETVRIEGDHGWPYQLVAIDFIDTRDRFPNLIPPVDASPSVNAGFSAFRMHCSRCHALGGDGGTIGPELNGAVRPIEVRDAAWLRRWIDDPSQILPTARMPRLNPALPDRAQLIDDVIAYLAAMSAAHPHAATQASPEGH